MNLDASELRRRAWEAGLDPAYWYPVEYDGRVAPGQVIEVRSQHAMLALFRGRDGRLVAVDDRCAHRHVKLSAGRVEGCRITCRYHGWSYDAEGRLVTVPHERFGHAFPAARLRSYPVRVRYGLIWVFLGDPALAEERPLPRIPEIDGEAAWPHVVIDFMVRAHPTAIVNNVMDSTHVPSLHRQFRTRTLVYGKVTNCDVKGDTVTVGHDVRIDRRGLLQFLLSSLRSAHQDACYEYPYLWVGVGGVYKLWNFMLPIDARTTRVFMVSCADLVKIPFTRFRAPVSLLWPALGLARRLLVRPLFEEDVWSFEAEQQGYETSDGMPSLGLHPAIRPCYELTIRKWQEHLACVTM
ncbi:MAG TPA: Rieske 2Fe-2S domain-containing protein [Methylomirabilota bacterium]|nr:Rieske 2Fe-2S domain-containing protein [Methylomirabilota bacterium]